MYPSIITSTLLSLLLIAASALAHEGHHIGDVTITTDITTESVSYFERVYPPGSYTIEIDQGIALDNSHGRISISSEGEHGDSTNFPYLTATWTDAATGPPQMITPGPVTQPSSVPTGDASDHGAEDLTLTETSMESVLSTNPEVTSVSLPVFTYNGGAQTSVTGGAESNYETTTPTEGSLPVPTLVTSTTPAYTNRTANLTSSRMDTVPTATPNSAGSVIPFLSSIAAVLVIGLLSMGV